MQSRSHPRTLAELFTQHRLFRTNFNDWRLVQPPILGEVLGLPSLRGWLVATDGVLAVLETETGNAIDDVHLFWFVPDSKQYAEFTELCAQFVDPSPQARVDSVLANVMDL